MQPCDLVIYMTIVITVFLFIDVATRWEALYNWTSGGESHFVHTLYYWATFRVLSDVDDAPVTNTYSVNTVEDWSLSVFLDPSAPDGRTRGQELFMGTSK
jgi:hypothetical protein